MSTYLSDGEIDETSHAPAVRNTPTLTRGAAAQPSASDLQQTSQQICLRFHSSISSKLQQARTGYKLLFTRFKRQKPLSDVDEFDIPTFKATDGNDNLRWEFNFRTVERTVWYPLFEIMQTELQQALEEIRAGTFAFADITLQTVDELLDRSLAHNKELRTVLANVENPQPSPPPKAFVAAELDLSEFDNVGRGNRDGVGNNVRGGGVRGGSVRGGGATRGGDTRRGEDRGRRNSSRGSREPSRGPDLIRGRGDLFRGRGDLTRGSRESSRTPRDSSRVRRDASRDREDQRRSFDSSRPEPRRRRDAGERPYF